MPASSRAPTATHRSGQAHTVAQAHVLALWARARPGSAAAAHIRPAPWHAAARATCGCWSPHPPRCLGSHRLGGAWVPSRHCMMQCAWHSMNAPGRTRHVPATEQQHVERAAAGLQTFAKVSCIPQRAGLIPLPHQARAAGWWLDLECSCELPSWRRFGLAVARAQPRAAAPCGLPRA